MKERDEKHEITLDGVVIVISMVLFTCKMSKTDVSVAVTVSLVLF